MKKAPPPTKKKPATPAPEKKKEPDYHPVTLRLPRDVYIRIPSNGEAGKYARNGASRWIMEQIHKALGLPLPEVQKKLPDLSKVDLATLEPKQRLIVGWYNKGFTPKAIVSMLKEKNIPTDRGGQWEEHNLIRKLEGIARRLEKAAAKG